MKFGVVIFPGSNCDHDALYALGHNLGEEAVPIWHASEDLQGCDALFVPGGFSYGDYLRVGAIARFSPVMKAVEKFAQAGGIVIGVCNGFQILTEAGLLPGVLIRNARLRFACKTVHVRVEATDTPFTSACELGQVLEIPIAHHDGSYHVDESTRVQLERERRIAFRYCLPSGELDETANPNGSVAHIAGVLNPGRNVMGMMPHPERAADPALGGADGLKVLESMAAAVAAAI